MLSKRIIACLDVRDGKVVKGVHFEGLRDAGDPATLARRYNIDGIDEMKYTNKIEAFTIKQGIKKMYTGNDRFPQIEPTKIDFPNISGTISLEYADKLLAWHEKTVMKGQSDTKAQKTGSIEFLSPNRADTIFNVNLYEMGISSLQILQSSANQDQIKRVKFDLFVGRMDLDGGGSLGME